MPRSNESKGSPEALPERLLEWLHESGYPLEMRTASTFQLLGFNVAQGSYYKDPESGTAREIDVVASIADGTEPGVSFSVVAECKRSPDKPWVLFVRDRIPTHNFETVFARIASAAGRDLLQALRRQKVLDDHPAFTLPPRIGYGLTQAFTKAADVAYAGLMSTVKASIAEVSSFEEVWTLDEEPAALVTFPTVVVQGRLFEYSADAAGADRLQEVPRGKVIMFQPGLYNRLFLVDVVTEDYLVTHASELRLCLPALSENDQANKWVLSRWEARKAKKG